MAMVMLFLATHFAWAGVQEFSASVPVVNGDLDAARQQALRAILLEAGLNSEVEIKSMSSLLNFSAVQSSLIVSRVRLKRFSVITQDVVEDQLKMSARLEVEPVGQRRCEPVLLARNLAVNLRAAGGLVLSMEEQRNLQLFLDELHRRLGLAYPPVQEAGEPDGAVAYQLTSMLEADRSGPPDSYRLALRVLGQNGSILSNRSLVVTPGKLAVMQRQSLGYAVLVAPMLSAEADRLLNELVPALADMLRCLPTLVRLPGTPQEQVRIDAMLPHLERMPIGAFIAERFPVAPDGAIDLLSLDAQLEIDAVGEGSVLLRMPKNMAGKKAPGQFILLQ